MATVAGINNGCGLRNLRKKQMMNGGEKNKFLVKCVSSSVVSDPYQTLKIRRGASESEVKKAFRQLALKYHPDVCKGSNCTTQFHQIYQAYDVVMNTMKGGANGGGYVEEDDEPVGGSGWGADQDWDLWEEWMGWEGAGIRDYSSHINPYA